MAGSSPFTVMTTIFLLNSANSVKYLGKTPVFAYQYDFITVLCTILKHTTFITLQEEKKRQRETENQISMTRDTCTYPRSNLN